MTRPKTISDEDLLEVARKLFRAHGHGVSTRQVAESAGISEAIIYQRFGSKDELFFASMAPSSPDLENILGPETPTVTAAEYLEGVVVRMANHFAEVLPLGLRIMTHPAFDHRSLERAHAGPEKLIEGVASRLTWFEERHQLRRSVAGPLAHLLTNLAHDWALSHALESRAAARKSGGKTAALAAMVKVIWTGAAPPRKSKPSSNVKS